MRFSTAFALLAAATGSVDAWSGKVLLHFLVQKACNALTLYSVVLRGRIVFSSTWQE
jgi:hypothetical protein